ncbi:hypothetical protein [Nonomuraea sp. NPDC050202]|uniref:hypothetical protein n=1 Tax=Nonomuraea sp. NPDC050202 TaxID=3155035 RepID=UPI00340DF27D
MADPTVELGDDTITDVMVTTAWHGASVEEKPLCGHCLDLLRERALREVDQ